MRTRNVKRNEEREIKFPTKVYSREEGKTKFKAKEKATKLVRSVCVNFIFSGKKVSSEGPHLRSTRGRQKWEGRTKKRAFFHNIFSCLEFYRVIHGFRQTDWDYYFSNHLYMQVETDRAVAKIGSSLKANHHNQVKLFQIFDNHCKR